MLSGPRVKVVACKEGGLAMLMEGKDLVRYLGQVSKG